MMDTKLICNSLKLLINDQIEEIDQKGTPNGQC